LYYFNARWYDPELGRFITEDPVKDGVNWFSYVANNPLRYTDPTGLRLSDDDLEEERKSNEKEKRLKELEKELDIKEDYLDGRVRQGEKLDETRAIVVHSVGQSQLDKDSVDRVFLKTNTSSHFFVDHDGSVYNKVPTDEYSGHASDNVDTPLAKERFTRDPSIKSDYPVNPNRLTESIEMAIEDGSGTIAPGVRRSSVVLAATRLLRNNLNITDGLRHEDVSGKQCPQDYADARSGGKPNQEWNRFKKDVKFYMDWVNTGEIRNAVR
jgi:hypothetical protein